MICIGRMAVPMRCDGVPLRPLRAALAGLSLLVAWGSASAALQVGQLEPMPLPLADFTATLVGSSEQPPRVFLLGGCVEQNCTSAASCACTNVSATVLAYVPGENIYLTNFTAMPRPRYRHMTARSANFLFVAGGLDERGHTVALVDRYDITRDRWEANFSSWPAPSSAGAGFALTALPDMVYFAGGLSANGSALRRVAGLNLENAQFEGDLAPMPRARAGFVAQVLAAGVDEEVWALGGASPATDRFSARSRTWIAGPALTAQRVAPAAGVANGALWVGGGQAETGQVLATSEALSGDLTRWQSSAVLPAALARSACATEGGQVFVFGGQDSAFVISAQGWSVGEDGSNTPLLDAGGTAGVIIAALVFAAAVFLATYWFIRRRRAAYANLIDDDCPPALEAPYRRQERAGFLGIVQKQQSLDLQLSKLAPVGHQVLEDIDMREAFDQIGP